jgi:hypothetical protein
MKWQWIGSVLLAVLLAMNVFVVFSPKESKAGASGNYIVRLYSGGKVVGKWRAVGTTALDVSQGAGESLVFSVEAGVDDAMVRIRGTWSIEPESSGSSWADRLPPDPDF